ncbi:MAG: hypothetical protein ACFFDN_28255 [Candidatus Hodarchaeota archaeon]
MNEERGNISIMSSLNRNSKGGQKMDDNTKRKLIRNYFKPFPKWTTWMILIGVVIFFIGILATAVMAIIGVAIMGLGVLGIVLSSKGKPTDSQMEEFLEEDKKKLAEKAIKKLGIDESELVGDVIYLPPGLIFQGWDEARAIRDNTHLPPHALKVGKDKILRFGAFQYQAFFPTDKFLGSFGCVWDFCSGESANEQTEEFFYKDVVSVTTKTEDRIISNPKTRSPIKISDWETFRLSVSRGESISVILRSEQFLKKFIKEAADIPTTTAEKAIQTVRTILREKKA